MRQVQAAFKWLLSNLDPVIVVALAIIFGTLGFLDILTVQQSVNATLATLGVVAFVLIRERSAREFLEGKVTTTAESVKETGVKIQGLSHTIAELDQDVRSMNTEIKAITPRYVARDLEQAMIDTDRWHYKGGTGTYLRAVTLKKNGDYSNSKKKHRQITIEIMDPTNALLCEHFSRYRRSLSAHRSDMVEEEWTTKRVYQEAYATILAACFFHQKYGLLDIELGLSSVISRLRYDISSQYAIISQEDRRAPCLKAEAGSWFYNSFVDELRLSLDQARKLDVRQADQMDLADITPDIACEVFLALGVTIDPSYANDDLLVIIDKAVAAKNPYD